jgi:hypothetical protein
VLNIFALFCFLAFSAGVSMVFGVLFAKSSAGVLGAWAPLILSYAFYLASEVGNLEVFKPFSLHTLYPIYRYLDGDYLAKGPFVLLVLAGLFSSAAVEGMARREP